MTEKIVNRFAAGETLRLVARLDAPEGLAERVKTHLARTQEQPARGRVLPWPAADRVVRTQWLRGAVAAGLLLSVAGGGVSAYRWVAPAPVARTAPAAVRPAPQQNFSTGGAMRTPVTLHGPVVVPGAKAKAHDANPHAKQAAPVEKQR